MKVIATDNFNREHISERVVAENVGVEEAEKICREHNTHLTDERIGEEYYAIKDDDYVPYKWEP